jgi:hypothetical protein
MDASWDHLIRPPHATAAAGTIASGVIYIIVNQQSSLPFLPLLLLID